MTEPESADAREDAPEPWPLHVGVASALKGLSPFGVILAWGLAAMFGLVFMSGSSNADACIGLSCSPVLGFVFATVIVVLPVTAVSLGLLGLMTLLRFSVATRLWTAAIAPPIGFVLVVLILG